MHVADQIDQPAAFFGQLLRYLAAVVFAQLHHEAVGRMQADGQRQRGIGHLATVRELLGRVLRADRPQGDRGHRIADRPELVDRHAAARIHLVYAGLRAVEDAGRVGEHDRVEAHHLDDPADLAHVGRFDPAGNDVDPTVDRLAGRLGKVVDHRRGHVRETCRRGADIARRVRVDDELTLGDQPVLPGLLGDLRDVVADRLRQARRVDRDNVGFVDREDVVDRLQQVRLAAEHGRAFGERTRSCHDRLFVVPRERAAVIGTAALRAVAVRQAAADAECRVHRPDRLARLGRVDRQGLSLGDFAAVGMSQ